MTMTLSVAASSASQHLTLRHDTEAHLSSRKVHSVWSKEGRRRWRGHAADHVRWSGRVAAMGHPIVHRKWVVARHGIHCAVEMTLTTAAYWTVKTRFYYE